MKKTILYIMSDVRSGSTLLENILATTPYSISVGELKLLETYVNYGKVNQTEDLKCNCGNNWKNCELWSDIITKVKDKYNGDLSLQMKPKTNKIYKLKNYPNKNQLNNKIREKLNFVYSLIFINKNVNTIIDSSKDEIQLLGIYNQLDFDVKIIYIKRDIRAVTYSKLKWLKKLKEIEENKYKILFLCALKRIKQNLVFTKIAEKDKLILSYEEIAKDTQKTLDKISEKFDLEKIEVTGYMNSQLTHAIAGTPDRTPNRKIVYDDTWRQKSRSFIFNTIGSLLNKLL